ncbi:VWA domain-containing protein [Candidatus Woesearchaeota archaeon]|nr:VWA domain-containing protein [Candidatus Woesearchaeota archaeon]
MKLRKSQAALEFLMTYGWAMLATIVIIAVLVSFGVVNPSILLGNKCTLTTGISCLDQKIDSDTRMIFLEIRNGMGKGIMINKVNVTGEDIGPRGCSLDPNTRLPPQFDNPLDNVFSGSKGARVKDGKTITLPVRCYDQMFGSPQGKSRLEINMEWHYDTSSSKYNHVADGEIYTEIKKGECEEGTFYVSGLDGSSDCCNEFDAYVVEWECVYCPDEKPYFAYITGVLTGQNSKEIAFVEGAPPFINNTELLVLPCQADFTRAEFDISNERSLSNESDAFSAVLVTDVSGSMGYRFNSSSWPSGTWRSCVDDGLFLSNTARLALAKCAQTGIDNINMTFEGFITKLLQNFSENRVGLVTFASTSIPRSVLTNNIGNLNSNVDLYNAGGGTQMESGLRDAVNVLQTDNPNSVDYIILISDGEESFGSDSAGYVCGVEFPLNTTVYALGIGPVYFFDPGFEGDCDHAGKPIACRTLQDLTACSGGKAYSAMTPDGIVSSLEEIAGIITHYPSNLNVVGIQYTGLLKGTYNEPIYLNPKPNITNIVQALSDSCAGNNNLTLTMSSDSIGYAKLSNIDIRACSATEFP